jgi:protein gp37
MNNTGIIWTEKTWNPVSGCKEVSEGCKFCYAKTLAENKRGTPAFRNGFDLTVREHKLTEPFKIKTPTIIFVNSMSDLFWDEIPESYRDKIVDVIEQTPQHQYQVLTKRPELMLKYSERRRLPDNFWAGTTVENERQTERIDILRKVRAKIRFLSIEPLIGAIETTNFDNIHWVITGGESGVHLYNESVRERRGLVSYIDKQWDVREDRADWVRSIRDACITQDVRLFHKQWGGATSKSAGRLLDGRTWDEFPDGIDFTNYHA